MEGYKSWESADELRDHSKLDEVLRLNGGEVGVPLPLVLLLTGQGTLLLASLCCSSPTLPTLRAGKKTRIITVEMCELKGCVVTYVTNLIWEYCVN